MQRYVYLNLFNIAEVVGLGILIVHALIFTDLCVKSAELHFKTTKYVYKSLGILLHV